MCIIQLEKVSSACFKFLGGVSMECLTYRDSDFYYIAIFKSIGV